VECRVANLEHRVDTNAHQVPQSLGVGMVDNDGAESGEGAWGRKLCQNFIGMTHPVDSGTKRNVIIRPPYGRGNVLDMPLRLDTMAWLRCSRYHQDMKFQLLPGPQEMTVAWEDSI
jgi:hypothetical protein